MKTAFVVAACALLAFGILSQHASAKSTRDHNSARMTIINSPVQPANSADIQKLTESPYAPAQAETTLLAWWQFDTVHGGPDEQGWIRLDCWAQHDTFFHVDGIGSGCCPVTPISGEKSMWCGRCPAGGDPYCRWATLPGYGNNWVQYLESQVFACTTLTFSYTAEWDSEPWYDQTYVEYRDDAGGTWIPLPVDGGVGFYDGTGGPLPESFVIAPAGAQTKLRFRFESDGAWSDEDGLSPSNEGALKLDDITVACSDAGGGFNFFEDFEDETCGQTHSNDLVWQATVQPGFGTYFALHSGTGVLQEDPCTRLISNIWGSFDDPEYTNYACGGHPEQGAVPFGPDEYGHYMCNEIWSPWVPDTGIGEGLLVGFKVYRGMPLDNLIFYTWRIRSLVDGCPTRWYQFDNYNYGGQKDWLEKISDYAHFVQSGATHVQLALSAHDMCEFWCGVYGTGECHSQGPLFDQVRLVRVDRTGPQYYVRDLDLFQDNFPEDGTASGAARADVAYDMIFDSHPVILPGDSLAYQVTDPGGLADDPQYGGAAVYLFAKVVDRFGTDKGVAGSAMESPDVMRYPGDVSALKRYPYCGSAGNPSAPPGLPAGWHQFRCDAIYTVSGHTVNDRFCADLMDVAPLHAMESPGNTGQFVPGDVVRFFLGARNALGEWTFWHRTLNGQGEKRIAYNAGEAAASSCEFSILPDAGRLAEGKILFVDAADDRGGPAQLYFDTAFDHLGLGDLVDRYDVLAPSSLVNNSLASRVKNIQQQIVEPYQIILWNTSELEDGLAGDGSYWTGGNSGMKPDDFGLFKTFLESDPDNPGIYAAGDDFAEKWVTLTGANAIAVRSAFMNFNFVTGDHRTYGESVSPLVAQSVGSPIGPSSMIALGGCPVLNDFDLMTPQGPAVAAMDYVATGGGAVLAQATATAQATTARFVLSGFGYNFIRDDEEVPLASMDRVVHLRDILTWLGMSVADPVGIKTAAFENRLDNNYPNPFNPTTTIKYSIAERGHVTLKIYDAAGRRVRTLVDEVQPPRHEGYHARWDGTNDNGQTVSSGVYFYKLSSARFSKTKKMVFVK